MNILISTNKSQKALKAFFSGFLIFSFIFAQVAMPLSVAYAQSADDTPAVEKTEAVIPASPEPEVQKVVEDEGSEDEQAKAPQQVSLIQSTATVIATKVVCASEADLPNWGAGGANITSTTASDYVLEHPSCHTTDWTFEWASSSTPNPGDNQTLGGAGWTPFLNSTPVPVPTNPSYVWVREQLPDTYIPFSGDITDPRDQNVSAELYCNTDVLNYDNYDRVDNMATDGIYHCVGFNVQKEKPLQCNPEVNLIQNGDFEAPVLSSGTWSIIPSSNSLLKWMVDWILPIPLSGILGLEIQNNVAGAPAGGNQHAELDGDHPVTIWQDIPTIAGKQYSLTFKYSPRPGRDAADNSIQPKIDGVVLGAAISVDGTANTNTAWQTITRTFMGTGSPVKVELADAGTDTSYGGYLDDVAVNCNPEPILQCDANASSTIVSDSSTQVDSHGALALSYIHPGWTANIPGATWIWATDPVESPTNDADLTKVFTKTFSIVGTPTSGNLEVAADNSYTVKVNGTSVPVVFAENNFQTGTQDSYDVSSLLISGINTLEISVTNWEINQDANPAVNPAGLLYKLSISNDECITPPPTPSTSTVTMCKTDDAQPAKPLSGWQLMLSGASVGSVDVLPNGSDFKILGVPAGNYLLKATGQYTYRGTAGAEYSDAAYSKRDAGDAVYQSAALDPIQSPFLPWVRENNFPNPNTGWLGVKYNNAFTDWGSMFNPTHKYALGTTTASLGDMSFKILDDIYGDNSGHITINANKGYSGITEQNGCVTFTDVPYGAYNVEEMLQDGWTNVSGLMSVMVDEPTETFTVVNHDDSVQVEPTGSIEITKYTCPANFVPNRTNNGVGSTAPDGCVLTSDVEFGYVHGVQTDANSPYPELDATLTSGGVTGVDGKLTIGPVSSDGRYLIKETDPTNLAGLYCEGDGDTNPNNNDNQELTFVTAGVTTHCVAYNKTTGGGGGDEETNTSHTTVVKAGDLDTETNRFVAAVNNSGKWFFYNDENDTINNTLGSFVAGPDTAPEGNGSAQMSVSGTERKNIATYQFKDVKLSDIKSLSFSTYSQLAGDGQNGLSERAPYLHFNVDFLNNDTWQRRLVYVPGVNGVVTPDSWQSWDAIDSGNALWLYSGATWPTTVTPGTTPKTWNQILALYPNAETRSTDSWFGFRVGEPYANGFTGNVDKFVIGIKTGLNTHTETYDFEPTAQTPLVCDAGFHVEGENCVPDPTINSGGGGGGGGGGGSAPLAKSISAPSGGQVLGASTSCGIYLNDYLKFGQKNNAEEVMKLQTFLNDYLALNPKLKVDGKFGLNTFRAVIKFQQMESLFVLQPWVGITLKNDDKGTGWVYKTTRTRINNIMCPELNLSIPPLVIN
ncbi:MAG: DUF642 domain-containing protein [Candidatus Pacebacteria bacterium]|nr:DUF642 domain-containing protein [Candidatus Paceibacterota bacterium]